MENFFKENSKWLTPGIAMLLIAFPPMIAGMVGIQLPVPTWLPIAAITLGMMGVGYGILVTHTFAARVAGIVIPAILLAMIAVKVFA